MEFREIGQEVFLAFVRSALIIDDHWPETTGSPEVDAALSYDSIGATDLLAQVPGESELTSGEAELSSEAALPSDLESIDAEMLGSLRHALLRKGVLTCGLRYQRADRDLAVTLARRADIVVLDWHLLSDDGAEALGILKKLKGNCLQFICIWTADGNVEQVQEKLVQNLSSGQEVAGEPGDLRLSNLVISIRVKKPVDGAPEFSVGPDQLLDVAVEGLINSFGGLVQLAMLEMTNRHREHLPEILEHIGDLRDTSLDAAVLLEAGDTNSPIGPGGAFLAVLVDEWRSRLERDSREFRVLGSGGRQAFGSKLWRSRGGEWTQKLKNKLVDGGVNNERAKQYAERKAVEEIGPWLESGCEGLPRGIKDFERIVSWAALQAIADRATSLDSMLRLEALLHEQFDSPIALTQGTLVRVERAGAEHFLLCTTPLCDAARPKKIGYLFTFIRAEVVPKEKVLHGIGSEHYCVVKVGGGWLCLNLLIKERVSLEIRNPNFGEKGVIQAFSTIGEASAPAESSVDLHLVAQLRLEHALSLTAFSAAEGTRIGVNKVELIRSRIRGRS